MAVYQAPHHRAGRGEPAQARYRPHRHLSLARVGRHTPLEKPRNVGHPGRRRQGAVSRGVELRGLATDEGSRCPDRNGLQRFVANQVYYSLEARDVEYELMPLSVDQGLGILCGVRLAGGLLSGKYRRGRKPRRVSGISPSGANRGRDEEKLYKHD